MLWIINENLICCSDLVYILIHKPCVLNTTREILYIYKFIIFHLLNFLKKLYKELKLFIYKD